jgi:hypothetical protein
VSSAINPTPLEKYSILPLSKAVNPKQQLLEHCPPFGKSDHNSILLIHSYRQKLKQEELGLRTIQCWSDQSESTLQDCFDHVDWNMFRVGSDNNNDHYTDTVTEFIMKCI